jgi:hypothetical protein
VSGYQADGFTRLTCHPLGTAVERGGIQHHRSSFLSIAFSAARQIASGAVGP